MESIELTSKIAGIIIVSEITIRILYNTIGLELTRFYKPYVVMLVSFFLYFFEHRYNYTLMEIFVKSAIEYASVAMMSYEIIVKRVFGEIVNGLEKDEKHRHI